MVNKDIQKQCEILEDLVDRECRQTRITSEEFNAINRLLLELQTLGLYDVPDRYLNKK
jgi:hypothetical protein